ncbi:MAG: hypothetical protein EBY16_04045 [Gammaproteobacteria bacterium]|nr:hypothetical protein [Gammaproteobacteria bacterium]
MFNINTILKGRYFIHVESYKIMITHKQLIQLAQKFGYPVNDAGICHGFTMRWIEAVLTGDTKKFEERLFHIHHRIDGWLQSSIIKHPKQSDAFESKYWDVKAFFESLLLFQERDSGRQILGSFIRQDDIEKLSVIASSDKMRTYHGESASVEEISDESYLQKTDPLCYAEFEQQSIKPLLTTLKGVINRSAYKSSVPFTLSLMDSTGNMHAACISYNPIDNTWQFMDVNTLPLKKPTDIDSVIKQMPTPSNFPSYNFSSFTICAILPARDTKAQNLMSELGKIGTTLSLTSKKEECLFLAACVGDIRSVASLLDKGVEPNYYTSDYFYPLHIATQNGHVKIVELLLAKEPNVNISNERGYYPLHIAAQIGHVEIVELLLAKEAKFDKENFFGYKPIDLAAQHGHVKIVELLLAKYKDMDYKEDFKILHLAAKHGHVEIVELLLAKTQIEASDGESALLNAAQHGHVTIVERLLSAGVNINSTDSISNTSLALAAVNGHLPVVEALLASGSSVKEKNSSGDTALHHAAEYGHLEVVKELIASGSSVKETNNRGDTALHLAAEKGHLAIVEVLLERDAMVESKNTNGNTAIDLALKNRYFDIAMELIAKDAKVGSEYIRNGNTLLHLALENQNFPVVDKLIKRNSTSSRCNKWTS